MTSSLTGKVAIITGSSQGIGRGIAERLSKDGATIVVHYKRDESEANAKDIVSSITDQGGQAIAVQADVTKPQEIRELFQVCLTRFGRPNIFVANAGVSTLLPLAETTEEEYDRVFGLNAKGTLFCLKEAAQHLQDGGRIVNISSSTTLFPVSGAYIYAASKATIKMFTEVAAIELGSRGITVNTVMPGVTNTPMSAGLPDDFKNVVIASSPFKRLGQPADIADAVAFLVSEDARWITGQHILVNGGANH